MRCTLRISQRGIFVDGDPMSRADAVAHCKHTAGAMVVFDDSATQRSDKTGNAIIVLNPSTTAAEWDATRSAVTYEQLVQTRDEATVASLREVLAGEDPIEIADLLADATERAEGMGRPLFSGVRASGRPADPVHRLWWACNMVREHRGDSHVAAAAAASLSAVEMNILTELWIGMPLLSYTGTRGWSAETMQHAIDRLEARGWLGGGTLTDTGRAARLRIEQSTDEQEQSIADALAGHIDQVCDRLNDWGQRCIDTGTFPPDVLKRAAG